MLQKAPHTFFRRPHLWLIALLGVIVPRRLRADWKQEWEAELNHRETLLEHWDRLDRRHKFDLVLRSASAFRDALWMQSYRWEDALIQDLRFAFKSLRKHAVSSSVIVATLTLGIGISTGVFTWFNAEYLRPRIDRNRESFFRVYSGYSTDRAQSVVPDKTTLQDYLAYREELKAGSSLVGWANYSAPLGQDDPSVTRAALVSGNFFSLYDPGSALLGRLLRPADEQDLTSPVIVLSERIWRNRFGADPQIVGRVTQFNGKAVTVVGVVRNFAGMVNGARAWLPYTLESYLGLGENLQRETEGGGVTVDGRLQNGFSRQQVAAELRLLAAQQDRAHPGRVTTINVTDGSAIDAPYSGPQLRPVLALILGTLAVLVLIVCVNVTTLLFARAAARQSEIAVRLALGSGRGRLIRTLLTETLLLSAVAGLASLYLAYVLPEYLDRWLTNPWGEGGGTWYSQAPDWRVFGYVAALTILAGIAAGLMPSLQSLKINISEMLKGRDSLAAGGRGSRVYAALISSQVALSLFLLICAVLFLRGSQQAFKFEPGFETRQVLWARLTMPSSEDRKSQAAFHRTVSDRLSALPGVQAVAWSFRDPFHDTGEMDVQPFGGAPRKAAVATVSPNYFSALDISLLSGRLLRDDDPPFTTGRCPIVVSERLAKEFWPNETALGRVIETPRGHSYEVVGIARDVSTVRFGGVDGPMIYRPWNPADRYAANPFIRFAGDVGSIARAATAIIREVAPEFPVEVTTIQTVRDHGIASIKQTVGVIVFICVLAVLVAVVGIYGVVAFTLNRRTREMGIRLALGARGLDVYRDVFIKSGKPVLVGVPIGLLLSIGVLAVVSRLLFGSDLYLNVWDPIDYTIAVLLLIGAAIGAMFGPARRATKIDPMTALRCD